MKFLKKNLSLSHLGNEERKREIISLVLESMSSLNLLEKKLKELLHFKEGHHIRNPRMALPQDNTTFQRISLSQFHLELGERRREITCLDQEHMSNQHM